MYFSSPSIGATYPAHLIILHLISRILFDQPDITSPSDFLGKKVIKIEKMTKDRLLKFQHFT